jgi:transcriptional regulator with XRE-family HTH domain
MPVTLPDAVWSRADVLAALEARNIGALFALAQQRSGVTQARMGTATGLGQGRVNEIVNGRRQVSSIEVLERVAAGLSMSDSARYALGLAPAAALPPPGVAWERQDGAAEEIRTAVGEAAEVDLLAVRALGLIGLNDSLLRVPLVERERPARVRVLLLDPDCEATARRAEEVGESPASFAAGIRMAITRLGELADLQHLDVSVGVYTALPVWRIIRTDRSAFLSVVGHAVEGHQSEVHRLDAGLLHAGFTRELADHWESARRVL